MALLAFLGCAATELQASTWYVAAGAGGGGSEAAPFGRIQDGIRAAQPGDTVLILPGTYSETLRSVRDGASDAPITVRARDGRGSVLVTIAARLLEVTHKYMVFEGLVLDGQYGPVDAVVLSSAADFLVLRDFEVRRAGHDCIDMNSPDDVLIERGLIHHCLNSTNGRTDAHGIGAGGDGRLQNLTIRDTEIHTFSGDAFQVDPNRVIDGWDNILIEGCRFWLAPLPAAENGFPAGTVAGENAVDTKVHVRAPRARLTIRNTAAWGFRGGLIANMAAFNIKENVDAVIDGAVVHDSEIAFRLRGPTSRGGAWVAVENSVVYDVGTAIRYEDNIVNLRVWNNTLGRGVNRPFQQASAARAQLDVRNLLVLGRLPAEASGSTNMSVGPEVFEDAGAHDYRLRPGASPVDAGATIPEVSWDRDGHQRPFGQYYDIGAFEFCLPSCLSVIGAPAPGAPPPSAAEPPPTSATPPAGGSEPIVGAPPPLFGRPPPGDGGWEPEAVGTPAGQPPR